MSLLSPQNKTRCRPPPPPPDHAARQDTGYSTESSESRRSRQRARNPFLLGNKSYSTSTATGSEMREMRELSETPSEYRALRDSDSETETLTETDRTTERSSQSSSFYRGSVMSGTAFQGFSATDLGIFAAR